MLFRVDRCLELELQMKFSGQFSVPFSFSLYSWVACKPRCIKTGFVHLQNSNAKKQRWRLPKITVLYKLKNRKKHSLRYKSWLATPLKKIKRAQSFFLTWSHGSGLGRSCMFLDLVADYTKRWSQSPVIMKQLKKPAICITDRGLACLNFLV